MKTIKKALIKTEVKAAMKAREILARAKKPLSEDAGMSETMEKLMWAVGAVVIVSLVVGLVYIMIKDDIMPEFKTKILELFDFDGVTSGSFIAFPFR